ncbi:MAG: (Fe-S)-binding protein [Thermoplasmata archaeon]|nr:(Fe-S)-binding protein [Thermoplasmata archaeon]
MAEEALLSKAEMEELYESEDGRNILTCIQCGMCAGTCPHSEYMEYTPRKLIAMMRAGFVDEVISSQSLMRCITCYSCMVKCPRGIKLTEVLLPFIKEKTFENLPDVPAELQKSFEDTQRYGNPLGESPRKRADWTKNAKVPIRVLKKDPSPVDVLWVVECYPSYYPRNIDATVATARLLNKLGVDFAILGEDEKCVGESARIFGEAGLFEVLTEHNMKEFGKHKFNKIVTSGVHAYDAFKNQYPDSGLTQPVQQIVPFLHSHLEKLKPLLKKSMDVTVTYHDSCVLGKHNGIYNEPRELLLAIPGVKLVEMAHTMENSLCCGGGGGGMWLDTYYKENNMERLSDMRVKEAVETGAQILAVSCPYEVSRFEDSVKLLGYEDKIKVRDIMELLDESAGGEETI